MSEHPTAPRPNEGRQADPSQMLDLLYRVTTEFSGTLDLGTVLGKVLSLTVQAVAAEKGSLFMLDEQGQVVRHILARPDLPLEERGEVVAAVMDKGLAGWVLRRQEAAIVHDTETDERWLRFPGDEKVVRAVLAAPLVRPGGANGIITLEHSRPGQFDARDLRLLTAIAQQAAIAIENASLFSQIREERDRISAVLNEVTDAILVIDDEKRRPVLSNPAAEELLGLSDEPPEGESVTDGLPSAVKALMNQVQVGQPLAGELEHAGRHFHYSVQAVPEVGTVLALHDVTHLREAAELKSRVVAMVSHDLKSPLTTILGYVWLLAEDASLSQEHRLYVNTIQSVGGRMQRLIENLLDLRRIESGVVLDRRPVSLNDLVSEVTGLYADQAQEKGIGLHLRTAAADPRILADRMWLAQAIANLVNNAVKYVSDGGHVEVAVMQRYETACVSVSDTGPGIALKDQSRLFEEFSRVGAGKAGAKPGTGLGLAIVRSVVESHGGRVWVDSDVGRGSTFYIELPRVTES